MALRIATSQLLEDGLLALLRLFDLGVNSLKASLVALALSTCLFVWGIFFQRR